MRAVTVVVGFVLLATGLVWAQSERRDTVHYVVPYKDPVIEELKEVNRSLKEVAEHKVAEILAAEEELKEQREDDPGTLRFDLSGISRPSGPDAFTTRAWHFPPAPQYLTGTCWSFSTTSFLESEIRRVHGREIRLSEMWSAYWEYVAKARGYVASRGATVFEEGSQSAAVMRALGEHGIVPRSAYDGVAAEDGRFNHALMHEAMQRFLEWCKDEGFWDEEIIIAMIRRILDQTMGPPPESVAWEGREYTPHQFMTQVCGLEPQDYVDVMSTLSVQFWQRGEYRVPDNWWRDEGYINVPLDVWLGVILKALTTGHSLVIGGDVSEPGLNGFEDVALVPTFDIPGDYIDQHAREFRFYNATSTDDHGIHMVGHLRLDGHDWFLIKDSNRSSRHGKFKGYYMYRDDYVRLKMLTIMVHRDVVAEILERVDGADRQRITSQQ